MYLVNAADAGVVSQVHGEVSAASGQRPRSSSSPRSSIALEAGDRG
jgi:hypothetical protein